jgi:hypothetical protein
LKSTSLEQQTPPPAQKEKQVLSDQTKLPCPGDKAYCFSSFGAALPGYKAKTIFEIVYGGDTGV